MQATPFNAVANFSIEQRQAVESIVGQSLETQDMVFVVVVRPGHEPSSQDKARARARLEKVFEQVDQHGNKQNLSPEQAEAAIDAAIAEVRSRSA